MSQTLLNSAVLGDLDSLAVIFDSTSLVHQLLDGILGWVAPGDEWVGTGKERLRSIEIQPLWLKYKNKNLLLEP